MALALQFRHRIGLLVGLAATALVTVSALALVLGRSGERQLAGIETLYLPLIELNRDLRTQSVEIPRALENAATAAEDSRLQDADRLYAAVVARLRAGGATIAGNGGDPVALERALATYYDNARQVAAALAGGASAGQLEAKIEVMRRDWQAITAGLEAATTPDRRRLAAAFATARASQRDAIWIDLAVATSALVLMGVLSWRIIRDTVRTLRAVAIGVERLARGDFAHEIAVTTRDELGDLARQANGTAVRLREYRRLLEERADELARASRHKSEFLASMSHELRTPLNSVLILSKLLADNPERGDGRGMTDKQVELATQIRRSGEELLALINEVLDLAKIEAGKQELVYEPVRLAELQDYLRRMFHPLAAQKGLAFEIETAGELPGAIRTDRTRLAQILKNLIANAIKFTERGAVTVRVSRDLPAGAPRGDAAIADPIVVSVSDTGIGIPADKQAWIFEAFAQAETGIARKFGGTGLGLTIARQLATRLGGDIVVDSAVGAGSTFSVVLPMVSAPDPAAGGPRPVSSTLPPRSVDERGRRPSAAPYLLGAADARDPDPVLDGKTVLIVDDDMRSVYALSSALTARRVRVITAADGREALEELERTPGIAAVVMDVGLPRDDGIEALGRIRAQARFRQLPILALGAQTSPAERERCIAAGATDHMVKPVELGQLLARLRTGLDRSG